MLELLAAALAIAAGALFGATWTSLRPRRSVETRRAALAPMDDAPLSHRITAAHVVAASSYHQRRLSA